ncbi:MAG: pyruvate, phosphate dikinase, partial [Planctomicrobium sp.]|nr:pyruvate, phosphate dikinase [Planctomicrobium sp.]
MTKHVYTFGGGKADGDTTQKNLLGGKGANLAEMNKIDLPVPAGFTLTTDVCIHFNDNNGEYPEGTKEQVLEGLKNTEEVMGAKFGCSENPLLLSCRSGARESMPGMM